MMSDGQYYVITFRSATLGEVADLLREVQMQHGPEVAAGADVVVNLSEDAYSRVQDRLRESGWTLTEDDETTNVTATATRGSTAPSDESARLDPYDPYDLDAWVRAQRAAGRGDWMVDFAGRMMFQDLLTLDSCHASPRDQELAEWRLKILAARLPVVADIPLHPSEGWEDPCIAIGIKTNYGRRMHLEDIPVQTWGREPARRAAANAGWRISSLAVSLSGAFWCASATRI